MSFREGKTPHGIVSYVYFDPTFGSALQINRADIIEIHRDYDGAGAMVVRTKWSLKDQHYINDPHQMIYRSMICEDGDLHWSVRGTRYERTPDRRCECDDCNAAERAYLASLQEGEIEP